MKRLLVVCNNLELGGVQKSLISLLKSVCNSYDVSLLLFSESGDYISQLPKNVKVIKSNKYLNLLGISQNQAKKQSIPLFLLRGALVAYCKLFNNILPRKIIFSTFQDILGFDIAISYTQNINDKSLAVGCNEFVLSKVKCNKKISFVHSDFRSYGGNSERSRLVYKKFDRIACVSNGCKDAFLSEIPSLATKTHVVYNFHDFDEIVAKGNQETKTYDSSYFNIITVARLSEEKGISRALSAIKIIKEKGFPVLWHIIGEGDQRQEIEKQIKELGLGSSVILYGAHSNPYKFIKNADLFMLPSLHEAAPIVFSEAQALKVPILTTKTISAKEMVEENQAGYVCENNLDGIVSSLLNILSNKEELNKKKLFMRSINNCKAKIQFLDLLEDKI